MVDASTANEIYLDVYERPASFEPNVRNLQQRLFDAYAAEVKRVSGNDDGIITAAQGDIDTPTDGFADNSRPYLEASRDTALARGPAPVSCTLPCEPRPPGTSGRGCGTPEIPNLINVPTETVTSTEIGIQSAKRRPRSPEMVQSLRTLAHHPHRDPRGSEAGVRAARLLCAIFLLQISVSAVTSRSICSSECSGVGVSRRRSVPRATVG